MPSSDKKRSNTPPLKKERAPTSANAGDASSSVAVAAVPAAARQLVKAVKIKKSKLVSNPYTLPKLEYAVLGDLKNRANELGRPAKKNELLRAGIKALAAMSDAAFLAILKGVPAIKAR